MLFNAPFTSFFSLHMHTALYDVLGVSPDASAAEITRPDMIKGRRLHPNKLPPDYEEQFRAIDEAYNVLRDPVRHAQRSGTQASRFGACPHNP
jgi:DnaJ-class molecular chaperone